MKKNILTAALLTVFLFSVAATASANLNETDANAVARYNSAKSSYKKVVNQYKKARQSYVTAKNKYIKYKKNEDLVDTLQKAKDFLVKADESMIGYGTMLERKAETVSGITETERQQILSEIRSDISWLESHQSQIANATTKQQLTDHGEQMKLRWTKIRIHAKKLIGKITIHKINWVIERGESISLEIENRIDNLKENGKDTAQLEEWFDEFNQNLDLAKKKRDNATEIYNQISTSGSTLGQLDSELKEANSLFRNGHNFIKEANQYVRAAYKNLKNIVKEIKSS
ncbi:MAG: hypothetical protein GWP19_16255 [Planctomycetia bacterium]|nr:hypothetical protein [Planctomycetia bacterium]